MIDQKTIIVLEQDDDFRETIIACLRSQRFSATLRIEGTSVFQPESVLNCDLILTGLGHGEQSGLKLYRTLLTLGFSRPFLLMSGAHRIDQSRIKAEGIFDLLQKPFSIGEMVEMVAKALRIDLLPGCPKESEIP